MPYLKVLGVVPLSNIVPAFASRLPLKPNCIKYPKELSDVRFFVFVTVDVPSISSPMVFSSEKLRRLWNVRFCMKRLIMPPLNAYLVVLPPSDELYK
ncbi:MAG: hypothetical protein IVZ94_03110 [Nitrospirae bacterium]|nr:hypothetical protein [Nitrospirota bacterium]